MPRYRHPETGRFLAEAQAVALDCGEMAADFKRWALADLRAGRLASARENARSYFELKRDAAFFRHL